jgi:N-acetylglucosamine kinase-like BadF-type ATPase
MSVVIGVDGGNSKTEVAVCDLDGHVLGMVRGPGCSPAKLGVEASIDVVEGLVVQARASVAGADVVSIATLLAGLDLPGDAPDYQRALGARFAGTGVVADNDTMAALLAGTGGGPGAAVVCGAGINAVARTPDGGRVGFLSLGQLTGDWGGGIALGREVLWSAIRDEDGRGSPTVLRATVCRHFGTASVRDVALGIHGGAIAESRLAELVPALFDADALGDARARAIIDRLIDEVAVMAHAVLARAGLLGRAVPLVLAGSVLTGVNGRLLPGVFDALATRCPLATPRTLEVLPVAGAVIAALQAARAPDEAARRVLESPLLAEVRGAVPAGGE